uniref:DDE-1 domain-containing protein n=1 Tax=Branchiostoma floridae TaxID=7739 RepID=C3ZUJ9_BRAFL|eukprot:XP_002587700.1 hypothetical protein BRAFLDRAFT_94603 [Branchiostoma floridae]
MVKPPSVLQDMADDLLIFKHSAVGNPGDMLDTGAIVTVVNPGDVLDTGAVGNPGDMLDTGAIVTVVNPGDVLDICAVGSLGDMLDTGAIVTVVNPGDVLDTDLLNKDHHLCLDNYFNSPPLFKDLYEQLATGQYERTGKDFAMCGIPRCETQTHSPLHCYQSRDCKSREGEEEDAINTLSSFLVATINDILEKYPDLSLVPKATAEKHPFMLFVPCHKKYSHAGLMDAEAIDELGKNSDKNRIAWQGIGEEMVMAYGSIVQEYPHLAWDIKARYLKADWKFVGMLLRLNQASSKAYDIMCIMQRYVLKFSLAKKSILERLQDWLALDKDGFRPGHCLALVPYQPGFPVGGQLAVSFEDLSTEEQAVLGSQPQLWYSQEEQRQQRRKACRSLWLQTPASGRRCWCPWEAGRPPLTTAVHTAKKRVKHMRAHICYTQDSALKHVGPQGVLSDNAISKIKAAARSVHTVEDLLLYQGKTDKCHASFNFPEEWDVYHTTSHWSNTDSMERYVETVVNPYMAAQRERLGLEEDHPGMAIFDVYKAHRTPGLLAQLKAANVQPVFVPASCTGELQPLDADGSINDALKKDLTLR